MKSALQNLTYSRKTKTKIVKGLYRRLKVTDPNCNTFLFRKSIERQLSFKRQLEQLQEQQEYQQQKSNSEDVNLENLNVSTDNEHWV